MSEYNGWTNWETWKAWIEYFDGMDSGYSESELEQILIEDIENNSSGIARSFAMDMIGEINFTEIAEMLE